MRQTFIRWSRRTASDIGVVLGAPLFWALFGAWLGVSAAVWYLPVHPTEQVLLAAISGLSVAMVLTQFHSVADFFDPPGGLRDLGHWYAFSWWLAWLYVAASFVTLYVSTVVIGRPVPAEIRNVLRTWIVASALIQLVTPFLARDETVDIRVSALRKGLWGAILVAVAVALVALLGMG